MQSIDLVVTSATPLLNPYLRLHWAKRRKLGQFWDWSIKQALGRCKAPGLTKCNILIERYESGRAPDIDNLTGGVKCAIDSLVKCGVIVDDNPQVIQSLKVIAKKCKRGEGKTVIKVEGL